jgi:hypothetical protein
VSNDRAIIKKLTDEWARHGWTNNDSSILTASQNLASGGSPASAAASISRNFYLANKVTKVDITHLLTLAMKEVRPTVEKAPVLKVLFVSAGPVDEQRLQLDAELRAIMQKIRAATLRDDIKMDIALAARQGDLLDAFNLHKPTLIHLSGHANATGVVFEDESGKADYVDMNRLDKLITLAGTQLKVVVLNACESADQAKMLAKHVDVSVGMSDSISDDAARAFSVQFYSSLGEGVPVETAFQQAKFAIGIHNVAEEDTPQIYFRSGIKPASYKLS